MKNRVFKITIMIIQISFFLIVLNLDLKCLFKEYLNVNCPACGLTRAFKSILNFNFVEAFNYNILSIPLFIIIIFFDALLFYDIIYNKSTSNKVAKHKVLDYEWA